MTTPTSVFTLTYNGNPAQLLGILWRDGDTGLAVIRVKGEGRFVRTVHHSELKPVGVVK